MRTDRLRVRQISDAAFAWYLAYLQALDAKDVEAYAAYLAEDCVLQMNNLPPVGGKQAIVAMLADYWQSFGSLEHDLLVIYGEDHGFVLEALNHYTRLDGEPVALRAVAFTDRNEAGLARSVRFYTDTGPLFA